MEYLCPVCNGISECIIYCDECGNEMKNGGRIQDYYDDYSPYLNYNDTDIIDGEPYGICQHIYICPACGRDKTVNIRKVHI
ncbi:MAG: hypothetical protein QME45_14475 [Clostridiales bacterium]|nr:hypothetical protein [Clostridiales bacterium]HBM80278.1 hypothetical protein [Clostridiaceae bacterium]